ncbi:MAG TPA: RHS repeat-associated core domain-containing protein [Myxococcales bacterium]|nr:RHS repeat-associated core domain-containing protein [Myxococcales bacterium]
MRAAPLALLASLAAAGAACGGAPSLGSAYLVYVRNAQGSVAAAVDDRGAKVWETHDDAYGLRLASSGTPVPREFLDQPLDEETGFYQFHYRSYDPATAQWLSPDPLLQGDPGACSKQPQLCNPYTYAGDRPGQWVDRDGQAVDPDFVLPSGEHVIAITIGVYGPDRARGAQALIDGFDASNTVPGNRRILYDVRVFDDRSAIPPSFHRAEADFNATDPQSSYDHATSTLKLRGDVAAADRGASVACHEACHAAGAIDGYIDMLVRGRLQSQSSAGEENSIMGGALGPQLVPQDIAAMLYQKNEFGLSSLNMGLTPPTPESWFIKGTAPPTWTPQIAP